MMKNVLMFLKRKSPVRIYEKRSGEEDFCRKEEFPKDLVRTLLILEDCHFYEHKGVNAAAIKKSLPAYLSGKKRSGASTITQQLVKNLYFPFQASFIRKFIEIILSLFLEKELSKDRILELYVNVVNFDNGQYGITAASEFYFGKRPAELTLNECVFLIMMLPVVGFLNPLHVPGAFCVYRDKKILAHRGKPEFTVEEYEEIVRHTPENLDEDLIKRDKKELAEYGRGPMVNEKYGAGSLWQKEI